MFLLFRVSVLLKPTIVTGENTWLQDARETRARFEEMTAPPPDPGGAPQ